MIPRISIFLISFYFSEACVRTIPPEEVYITSTPDNLPPTNAPSAPCATCPEVDLSKAELIPVGSMISKEEAITADGCKETTIRCSYTPTPGTVALSSSLNGILADGMTPHIGELPSPGIGKDYSILTCQNNGDYITSRGVNF
ncbi:Protein CBG15690 [Caenorhabditis briggsae]|uniref:Protein CBG15690 n=1 Tax=Caenorhabditis briggsae TaxID=6238 RepID=A8XMJ5_CAEBR|nr:Protein CBG15690 [Caenorhabditis briggsae]CAP33871.2 Protein CBG15690 [Caenorhabditis briggsae]